MDISPKTLREVEFREKFRGYHPEDVDTFLERVAVGIEGLQQQLRQATERAAHAEQLASETGTSDEALSRTLLLAQRTADMAVEEAQEQATRLVETAEQQAAAIKEEATQQAQRTAEESQASLRADLAALEAARDQLQADVDSLQQWIDQHRSSLTMSLEAVLQQLKGDLVVLTEVPALNEVDVPAEPAVAAAVTDEEWEDDEAEGAAGEADSVWADDDEVAEQEPDEAAVEEAEDALPEDDGPGAVSPPVAAAEDEPVEAAPVSAGDGQEDDPFMAELRRAVTDTEPLGPREPTPPPVADRVPMVDDLESRRRGSRFRRNR